jgi:hypothetical protein
MTDGPLVAQPRAAAQVLVVDTETLPWVGEAWPGCLPGLALKAVWTDEAAGPTLLLVGNVPRYETRA